MTKKTKSAPIKNPKPRPPKKALKRAKKTAHYKTGVYHSTKCIKPVEYRSSWELEVCKYLDNDPAVLTYIYEGIAIPYVADVRSGKVRLYFPDFLIQYNDGKKILVEVKRQDKITDAKVVKKTQAGKDWAAKQGITFQIWSNELIEKIRFMNSVRSLHQTVKTEIQKHSK